MNKLSWLLAGIVIATAAFVLILASPGAKAWQTGSTYGGAGDWTISSDTIVADETVTVGGNLNINAKLQTYNAIIRINSALDNQYAVTVSSTGTLNLYASTLTANSGLYHYSFKVSGNLDINQSYVSEMWGNTASWPGGIQILKGGAQVRNSEIYNGRTGGIYIYNVAATITGNKIYSNGGSGSSSYAYGIYVANDGAGTTTSTKIDGNSIYSNNYISGSSYYGYGLYSAFLSKTDTITNNMIYSNGHTTSAYSYGYQLYLQYSNATVTDDFLANGSYQMYVYGSSPPTLKNMNFSSYAYYSTSYGVYSYNSPLSFSKCTWYDYNGQGSLYGVYANGPTTGPASSQLDFTDCSFDYYKSGTYTRYFVYASYYTPVNFTSCTMYNMYGGTVYWLYADQYCPVNVTGCTLTTNYARYMYVLITRYYATLNVVNTNIYVYNTYYDIRGIYGYYMVPVTIKNCYMNISNQQYSGRIYAVYGYYYSDINIVSSTIEQYNTQGSGTPNTQVIAQQYSPVNITSSTLKNWFVPSSASVSSPTFYQIYAVTNCPVNISSSTLWEFVDFNPMYSYPQYPIYYMVYGNGYSNITLNYTSVTQVSPLQGLYSVGFYSVYASSYCPMIISHSQLSQSLKNTTGSLTSYLVYGNSYCPMTVDNSSFDQRVYNSTSSINAYTFNLYYYCDLFINDSQANMTVNAFGTSRYSASIYFIYDDQYSSMIAARCKFNVNNCTGDYYYGMYFSYGRISMDNCSYIASDINITYTEYHVRMYSYSNGDFCMTWCKFLVLNSRGNYYSSKNAYGFYIYDAGVDIENSTINCEFKSQAPWVAWAQDKDSMGSPYYTYGFLFYGYSGSARTWNMLNNNIRYYVINQTGNNYVFNWNGYTSAVWRNCYINITQAGTGCSVFVSQESGQVKWTMENVTTEYMTKIPWVGVAGCMFSVFSNTELNAYNSSFMMRSDAGIYTYNMFRYLGTYGAPAKLYYWNCSLEYNQGGGTGTVPMEVRPGGWLGYNGGPMGTVMFTNSTYTLTARDEPVILNVWQFRGSGDFLGFEGSKVVFNMNAPGSTVNLFYFDPAYTAILNKFSFKNSSIEMNVNRENIVADAFKVAASGASGLKSIEVLGGQFNIRVNAASTSMCSGINMSGIKAATFKDMVINAFGPSKVADPAQNTPVAGLLMVTSMPTIDNFTINCNGLGRVYGIVCDVVSIPVVSNTKVNNAYAGVWSKFFSQPVFLNCEFKDCKIGVLADGTSNVSIGGSSITNAETGAVVQDKSWLSVTECKFNNVGKSINLFESTAWSLSSLFDKGTVVFNDPNSTLIINWKLQMKVTWQNGVFIAGAAVTVTDNLGRLSLSATSNEDGIVPWFIVTEYIQTNYVIKTNFSPYTVKAAIGDLTGSASVVTDATKEAEVVVVDPFEPVLIITAPDDKSFQNFTKVDMIGSAVDVGSGIDYLSFSYDGVTWTNISASKMWQFTMEVPEGPWTLQARLFDIAGNMATAKLNLTVDLTAPFITVTSPADSSLGNKIGLDLSGKVEPASTFTVNHRPVTLAADGSFTYGLRLVEGKNAFSLFARDRAGNTNSLTWTLYLDITPPPLTLTGPKDGLLTNQKSVQVSGRTEPGALVTLNDAPVELQPDGSFSVQYTLTRGTNAINVVASDIAGNTARVLRTVLMDDEILLNVLFPEDNLMTNQITILIRGTTDTDALLRLNDGLVTVGADGNFSVTYSLQEGANVLTFSAVDRAGNSIGQTRRVVLDTISPVLEIESPASGSLLRTKDVTVSGICEAGMTLTVNGETIPTESGTFSKALSLSEGTGVINIEGRDKAGNTVSRQIRVLVDLTAPSLEIVEPQTGFRTRDLTVVVVGITEPGAHVTVNDAAVEVDAFGKFSTSVTLVKGSNTIKVSAVDEAGNPASKSITVKNTVAPEPPVQNTWWWSAVGILVALGLMIPLSMLLVNMSLRERKVKEGSQ